MRRQQRVLLWGVLIALLAVGIGLLAVAPKSDTPDDQGTLTIQVQDERGGLATWADVVLHRDAPTAVREAARWDPRTATFSIPREGAPHGLNISGPGFKTTRVDGIHGDATIEVERGFALHVDIEGDLPASTLAPRVLMVRMLPVIEGADAEDTARQIDQITRYMMPMAESTAGSMPLFETRGFGFALSAVDAAGGVRLPQAGRYRIDAGLLDMDQGLWQELRTATTAAVSANATEAIRVGLSVSAAALRAADRALNAQVEAIRAREQASSTDDAAASQDQG